jgi:predicted ATPase/DNA-binding SARP family transcriptional activator
LGPLRVILGGEEHTRFRTQKAAWLLAYLALHLDSAQPRERLVDLFWGDRDLAAGRDGLSTALAQLKRQFRSAGSSAANLFIADWQQVRLDPSLVSTDLARFDHLLQQAGLASDRSVQIDLLQEATSLYRGPILPGWDAEWAIQARTHYQSLFLDALRRLARLLEETERFAEALACIECALALSPYSEELVRSQMRLFVRLKRPSAALEAYVQREQKFSRDLGAQPSAATREMAETIRRDPRAIALLHAEEDAGRTESQQVATFLPQPPPTPWSPPRPACPDLPLQASRFFGRKREREALMGLLTSPETRLITVLGPGGIGKTRLAIEAAQDVAEAFENRVWFLPLADIPASSLILPFLASQLPPGKTGGADPLESIPATLGNAPCLLILDNLEHLLGTVPTEATDRSDTTAGCALVIELLLERLPGLVCLTTSRQPLRLQTERRYELAPLDAPDPEVMADWPTLANVESVALYLDRARASRHDFALNEQNANAIARLCHKLEGLPLAIEMAAAWAKLLSPQKTLDRLERQLDLLVSRRQDISPRHQSLRATIEWSYDLLAPDLRAGFIKLAVFHNGWTLPAARSLLNCAASPYDAAKEADVAAQPADLFPPGAPPADLDEAQATAILTALQERSMLTAVEISGQLRYRMPTPLREFALEMLRESAQLEAVRRCHADLFVSIADEARNQLRTAQKAECINRLLADHDNLRAAMDYCRETPGYAEAALQMVANLQIFWWTIGFVQEGLLRYEEALRHPDVQQPTSIRALALHGRGMLHRECGDYVHARQYIEESLSIYQQLGERTLAHMAMSNLGIIAGEQNQLEEAFQRFSMVLAFYREIGSRRGTALMLSNLGIILRKQGKCEEARTHQEESLALYRQEGERYGIALALHNLAALLYEMDQPVQAGAAMAECLTLNRDLGDRVGIAYGLEIAASGMVRQSDPSQHPSDHEIYKIAANACGAAITLRRTLDSPLPPSEAPECEATLRSLVNILGPAAYEAALQEGSLLPWQQVVDRIMPYLAV